jgi:hypothetical protein
VWRIDALLGNDLETNNVTNVGCTAVAMQLADKERCYASPFLGNGSVNMFAPQRIGTQKWSYFWKRCFLLGSCEVVIRKRIGASQLVEAGSNNSTVALRVVGGDEKGTQCLRATLFLFPTGWRSLESETVKCGRES